FHVHSKKLAPRRLRPSFYGLQRSNNRSTRFPESFYFRNSVKIAVRLRQPPGIARHLATTNGFDQKVTKHSKLKGWCYHKKIYMSDQGQPDARAMKRVVIIDPNPLLRRALVHLLSDISPDLSFEESDYAPLFARKPLTNSPDLVMLAFSRLEDLHGLATSVHHVYAPKAMMLLPDTEAVYPSIEGLPPTVAG